MKIKSIVFAFVITMAFQVKADRFPFPKTITKSEIKKYDKLLAAPEPAKLALLARISQRLGLSGRN